MAQTVKTLGEQIASGHSMLVEGPPRTGKTQLLVEAAASALLSPEDPNFWSSVLLLTPDRRRATVLDRELTKTLAQHPSVRRAGRETHRVVRSVNSYANLVVRLWSLEREVPTAIPLFMAGAAEDVWVEQFLNENATRWEHLFDPQILASPTVRMQIRNILARSGEAGLLPEDLAALADWTNRTLWSVAADVYKAYAGMGDTGFSPEAPRLDAARLPRVAAALLTNWRDRAPSLGVADVPPVPKLLLVDDVQDLPNSASLLVQASAELSAQVVLASTPSAASAQFRGGDFRQGQKLKVALGLPVEVLSKDLRPGPLVELGDQVRSWVEPSRSAPAIGTVQTQVLVAPTESGASALVANYLHRQHLEEKVPWRQMAVITRASGQVEQLRRQLSRAGVPLASADRPVQLAKVPICAALLELLVLEEGVEGASLEGASPEEGGVEESRDPGAEALEQAATDLVVSALVGMNPLELFQLVRDVGTHLQRSLTVVQLLGLSHADLKPFENGRHKNSLKKLAVAKALWEKRSSASEMTPQQGLWELWALTGLEETLRSRALKRDFGRLTADAVAASDQLDSLGALFRKADLWGQSAGLNTDGLASTFASDLLGQNVSADSLEKGGLLEDGVQVVTASSSAGLSWDVVCIMGPQTGGWPAAGADSLASLPLLQQILADAAASGWRGEVPLGPYVPQDQVDGPYSFSRLSSENAQAEARLFNLAVTRANKSCAFAVVSNVSELPSSFLFTLSDRGFVEPFEDLEGTPIYTTTSDQVTLPDLVGKARRDAVAGDEAQRADATLVLALLAAEGVQEADPALWGSSGSVSSTSPIVDVGNLRLSPSKIALAQQCPLRWFLSSVDLDDKDVGPVPAILPSSALGTLIHEIAQEHPRGTHEELTAALEEKWDQLELDRDTVWGQRAWQDALNFVRRLADYFKDFKGTVKIEEQLRFELGPATVSGRVDRLETTEDGKVRIVDIKTGKPATKRSVEEDAQLKTYQLAAHKQGESLGGAALLQVRSNRASPVVTQAALSQEQIVDYEHELEELAASLAGSIFPARVGDWCRMCEFKSVCPAQPQSARIVE